MNVPIRKIEPTQAALVVTDDEHFVTTDGFVRRVPEGSAPPLQYQLRWLIVQDIKTGVFRAEPIAKAEGPFGLKHFTRVWTGRPPALSLKTPTAIALSEDTFDLDARHHRELFARLGVTNLSPLHAGSRAELVARQWLSGVKQAFLGAGKPRDAMRTSEFREWVDLQHVVTQIASLERGFSRLPGELATTVDPPDVYAFIDDAVAATRWRGQVLSHLRTARPDLVRRVEAIRAAETPVEKAEEPAARMTSGPEPEPRPYFELTPPTELAGVAEGDEEAPVSYVENPLQGLLFTGDGWEVLGMVDKSPSSRYSREELLRVVLDELSAGRALSAAAELGARDPDVHQNNDIQLRLDRGDALLAAALIECKAFVPSRGNGLELPSELAVHATQILGQAAWGEHQVSDDEARGVDATVARLHQQRGTDPRVSIGFSIQQHLTKIYRNTLTSVIPRELLRTGALAPGSVLAVLGNTKGLADRPWFLYANAYLSSGSEGAADWMSDVRAHMSAHPLDSLGVARSLRESLRAASDVFNHGNEWVAVRGGETIGKRVGGGEAWTIVDDRQVKSRLRAQLVFSAAAWQVRYNFGAIGGNPAGEIPFQTEFQAREAYSAVQGLALERLRDPGAFPLEKLQAGIDALQASGLTRSGLARAATAARVGALFADEQEEIFSAM